MTDFQSSSTAPDRPTPIPYPNLTTSLAADEIAPPASNGPSVAALLIVLLLLPFLFSIPAIFFGIVGLLRRSTRRGFLIAGIVVGLAGLLLLVILLPALNQTRERARRIQCASNMRSIGLAMLQYANMERNGAFPDTIPHFLASASLKNDVFICLSSNDTPSKATNPNALAKDLAAGGHDSFIYVGAGLTSAAPNTSVLMYESMSHHKSGINVLFADTHVDFVSGAEATALLGLLRSGVQPAP